jgi:hypothetical protein
MNLNSFSMRLHSLLASVKGFVMAISGVQSATHDVAGGHQHCAVGGNGDLRTGPNSGRDGYCENILNQYKPAVVRNAGPGMDALNALGGRGVDRKKPQRSSIDVRELGKTVPSSGIPMLRTIRQGVRATMQAFVMADSHQAARTESTPRTMHCVEIRRTALDNR